MNCALAHPKTPKTKNRLKNELPQALRNAEKLKSFIRTIGIELAGVADLDTLENMPVGIPLEPFREHYRYAIVMGAPLRRLGKEAPGIEASIYLEKAALEVVDYLTAKNCWGLVIHTEDEFDPINRIGLMSLKVLAKAAGLGWRGRHGLIVTPEVGPALRFATVFIPQRAETRSRQLAGCGECQACLEVCPVLRTSRHYREACRRRLAALDLEDEVCGICVRVCWEQITQCGR